MASCFPRDNPRRLCQVPQRNYHEKDLRQKLGEKGRKWVESEVSVSARAVATKMATALQQVSGKA